MITKENPMCQVVLENPRLLPLFPRFNLRLGFGEMNVNEVCRAHQVDTDFFLEVANAYLDEDYVPGEGFSLFSLGTMVQYLTSTHTYYLETALPQVEEKIHNLLEHSDLSQKEIQLVTDFFNDYKEEFMAHISEEEQEVLPYILELEEQSGCTRPDPGFIEKLRNYSIREFEKEHERLETSLENLSRLIIKYLPPFNNFQLCNQVLTDLAALVKDLVDHADMEDKVLIPRVSELEQQLLQKGASA